MDDSEVPEVVEVSKGVDPVSSVVIEPLIDSDTVLCPDPFESLSFMLVSFRLIYHSANEIDVSGWACFSCFAVSASGFGCSDYGRCRGFDFVMEPLIHSETDQTQAFFRLSLFCARFFSILFLCSTN